MGVIARTGTDWRDFEQYSEHIIDIPDYIRALISFRSRPTLFVALQRSQNALSSTNETKSTRC